MLIDTHVHSKGISRCCRLTAPEVIKAAIDAGINGLVLTNHYQKYYVTDGDAAGFAARYMAEYRYARACGEELGIPVLFGIEVTLHQHKDAHVLIFGVDEEFVLRYPTIYDMSIADLAAIVHEIGGVLVQAHPYRRVPNLVDCTYLDGIEINCHPGYEGTHFDEVLAVARAHGLMLTAGGDYHADTRRPFCGMYLPDSITDTVALAEYVRKAKEVTLQVDEADGSFCEKVTYKR